MTKHSYSLMRPADFFQNFFSGFFRFFSAEKFFGRFFPQNFQRKNFSPDFFPRIFSGKIFGRIFSPDFFSGIFRFFPPEFFHQIFSAEYFFRITSPRIEFIGISFPFNQGFLFLLVAANNFFNSKNILICLLQFCFVK